MTMENRGATPPYAPYKLRVKLPKALRCNTAANSQETNGKSPGQRRYIAG
jgi:hypothetical protein